MEKIIGKVQSAFIAKSMLSASGYIIYVTSEAIYGLKPSSFSQTAVGSTFLDLLSRRKTQPAPIQTQTEPDLDTIKAKCDLKIPKETITSITFIDKASKRPSSFVNNHMIIETVDKKKQDFVIDSRDLKSFQILQGLATKFMPENVKTIKE